MNINQMDLINAVVKELGRQGFKSLIFRQTNAIIASVNKIIEECERLPVMSHAGMGLSAWLKSDDTGMSSEYMASVFGGFQRRYYHPMDLDDFGRCSRLLTAVPEFREKLEMMRDKSKQWAALLDVWTQVEDLMREKRYKEANDIVMKAVEE
jgi:hypothetical protein